MTIKILGCLAFFLLVMTPGMLWAELEASDIAFKGSLSGLADDARFSINATSTSGSWFSNNDISRTVNSDRPHGRSLLLL